MSGWWSSGLSPASGGPLTPPAFGLGYVSVGQRDVLRQRQAPGEDTQSVNQAQLLKPYCAVVASRD